MKEKMGKMVSGTVEELEVAVMKVLRFSLGGTKINGIRNGS